MLEPSLLGLPPCHILAKFPQEQSCMIEGRPHSCSPPQLISEDFERRVSQVYQRLYIEATCLVLTCAILSLLPHVFVTQFLHTVLGRLSSELVGALGILCQRRLG